MALNVTLAELLSDLRYETNAAAMPALAAGERDHMVYLLRKTQEVLANEVTWPHLTVDRDLEVGTATRYVAYPADLPFEAVGSIHTMSGSQWVPVTFGIGPCEYSLTNSDDAITGFPIQRWRHVPDTNTIEVWPVPSQTAVIRLRGQRSLRPLVDDTDTCDIDSRLIVLRAAVAVLARNKREDAQLKAQEAQRYLTTLLGRQSGQKASGFVMGRGHAAPRPRPGFDYIP